MSTEYHIYQDQPNGYSPRGGALQLWRCRDHEVMLSGPAETGKTYGALQKLDALAWKYPCLQAAMVRQTRASMDGTVLDTWRKVIGKNSPITPFGGEKPDWYDYPNGSRIHVGGMDKPERILSGERDIIYVNQAEELSLESWETLVTRVTGRAGNMPYAQLIGDCNPGPRTHWIKQRQSLRLLESRHEDNPTLFDEDGQITERGKITLRVLDSLTGLRHKRLRLGLWVSAEGVIYDGYDPAVHLIDEMPAGWQSWRKIRVFDFGYKNPFICLWIAIDGDGRMYVYRQIYMTERTVRAHAVVINEQSQGERYEANIADHDAEDRATLEEAGISTIAANKAVSVGIQAMQERLQRAGDGKPRLFILRSSLVELDHDLSAQRKPTSTQDEFENYVWTTSAAGKAEKDQPLKIDDHGMDALRYAVMYVDHAQPVRVSRPAVAGQRSRITVRT